MEQCVSDAASHTYFGVHGFLATAELAVLVVDARRLSARCRRCDRLRRGLLARLLELLRDALVLNVRHDGFNDTDRCNLERMRIERVARKPAGLPGSRKQQKRYKWDLWFRLPGCQVGVVEKVQGYLTHTQSNNKRKERMAAGAQPRGVHPASTTTAATTATKKATTIADAPIWKNYLAVRTEICIGGSGNWRQQFGGGGSLLQGRSRKRSKPSNLISDGGICRGVNWVSPSQALPQGQSANESSSVAIRVRKYWEQLGANERQQILFIDEPDLVKQLYKLNLSLLCVGLMQRHLKTPLRTTAAAKSAPKSVATTATTPSISSAETSIATSAAERSASENKSIVAVDTQAEKTYELLEAMEFMDIGTGILTVKSELVEDPGRLFSLVGEVLFGFVTSVHVLSEKQFLDLFVRESEVINSWEDYQRLIAMLVEQLILRSYVNFLEKEAAIQMEELLLEVSLEDTKNRNEQHKENGSKKKSKKKKKKKKTPPEDRSKPESFDDHSDENDPNANNADMVELDDGSSTDTSVGTHTVVQGQEVSPVKSEQGSKRLSALNPNASVFQPQEGKLDAQMSPMIGKRKLDKFVVSVHIQDGVSDDEYSFGDLDYSSEDDLSDGTDLNKWRQKRKREDDAELEWQLQQIYSSTSTMLGWDFARQCDVVVPQGVMPWDDSTFWRTAPKEVVRYFTPGFKNAFDPFLPPSGYQFPPGGPAPQSTNSRYYFAPSPSMSAATYLPPASSPPPHMLPPPPPRHQQQRMFAFQEANFRGVVTSPDFAPPSHPEFQDHHRPRLGSKP